MIEDSIVRYVSPEIVEWYRDRIEFNKTKEYEPIYWSFWGDLQYQLLKSVPWERLARKNQNLLKVLERKFEGQSIRYNNGSGHSGWVASPVTGKRIGAKQWLQIITNKKLVTRKYTNSKDVDGGFIESSLRMYSDDFQTVVKSETEAMIQLALNHKEEIIPCYIDALYCGAEFSDNIDGINQQMWEEMFNAFPCGMNDRKVRCFCGIIEKTKISTWSLEVLNRLKDIIINYEDTEIDLKEKEKLDCEKLYSIALNSVRGKALRAIASLLWENKDFFKEFKDLLETVVEDENPAVKLAAFYALWPLIILIESGRKKEFCIYMRLILEWLVFKIQEVCYSDYILNIKQKSLKLLKNVLGQKIKIL